PGFRDRPVLADQLVERSVKLPRPCGGAVAPGSDGQGEAVLEVAQRKGPIQCAGSVPPACGLQLTDQTLGDVGRSVGPTPFGADVRATAREAKVSLDTGLQFQSWAEAVPLVLAA